jgi:hypothetical protein
MDFDAAGLETTQSVVRRSVMARMTAVLTVRTPVSADVDFVVPGVLLATP